jgi:hypothetical protein
MNSEEIKKLTERSIESLMASMSQGKSESLVRYLRMVARFHHYSLHNVLLIALQRAVTCRYTSLESMNMRSCALLEASDGA